MSCRFRTIIHCAHTLSTLPHPDSASAKRTCTWRKLEQHFKKKCASLAQHHTALQKSVPAGQGYSSGFLTSQVLKFKGRAGSTLCRNTFHSPSSRLQQPKTCCKTNMDLKQSGPTKTLPSRQHNITIHSQRSVSVGQGYSNGFLMLQVLKFECCAGSAFCRGTFTLPVLDTWCSTSKTRKSFFEYSRPICIGICVYIYIFLQIDGWMYGWIDR